MTDNNVRIHLEPTPRHTHTHYITSTVCHNMPSHSRSMCTKDRVGRLIFICRLPLVFILFLSSDYFFLLLRIVFNVLCFFPRFSTLVWHISRCPISMFAPLWSSIRLLFVVIVIVIAVVLYYSFFLIGLSSCFDCLFVWIDFVCHLLRRRWWPEENQLKLNHTSVSSACSLLIRMSCDCRYIFGCILCVLCLVLHAKLFYVYCFKYVCALDSLVEREREML